MMTYLLDEFMDECCDDPDTSLFLERCRKGGYITPNSPFWSNGKQYVMVLRGLPNYYPDEADVICRELYDDYYPQPTYRDVHSLMKNGADYQAARAAYDDACEQWYSRFITPLLTTGKWIVWFGDTDRVYVRRK